MNEAQATRVITQEEMRAMGVKARKGVLKMDARFASWDIFSKSFGFYSWRVKNKFSAEQLAAFKQGFEGK